MYQVGFDVGGTNLKAGIVSHDMEIIAHRNVTFPKGDTFENITGLMAEQVIDMAKEIMLPVSDFKSIGVATAGSIDTNRTTILHAHNLGFHNVPMVEEMHKYFPQIPVFLANDADAAALAELHAGALRGKKTAVLLTLGTGVGGGIILGGKLFKGGQGHGNEIGHMIIKQGGPICTCGNKGCIESLCTATWLIQQGRRVIVDNPIGLIYEKADGNMNNVTAKIVIDSAKEGDPIALDIFNTFMDSLSSAITSIVVLLDPETVALGGGVSLAGEFLIKPVRELVKQKSFFKMDHEVVAAQLGNTAGIIGAAMFAGNE
ncbi:MAG: ROK family protein [Eubacteriales bacterium]|nr:ROK family protein [Eubacteriales bacterium]MDD3200083.1 ROK family protein [Eubacteriales bacterium]MDD4630355.1 ROK family protein [Eubacteriales bacterium]